MNQPSRMDDLYAPPAARVDDILPEGDFELAERLTRLAAAIIDGATFMVVVFVGVMGMLIPAFTGGEGGQEAAMIVGVALSGIGTIAVVVINLVYLHRNGQSLGKKLLNIKIVRTDGSRASLRRIVFLRWLPVTLLGSIPYLGGIFSLVDSLMIFRDSRKCLHDDFADTIVIKA